MTTGEPGSEPPGPGPGPGREQARGCVFATLLTALVALLLTSLVVAPALLGASVGYAAFFGLLSLAAAVVGVAVAGAFAIADRVALRRPGRRLTVGFVAWVAGVGLVLPGLFVVAKIASFTFPTDGLAAAGATLLVLAAVILTGPVERPVAFAFAAAWVLLFASVGYRSATLMHAHVVWLGPGLGGSRVQVAFEASRPADFVVLYGARSCSEGRPIASGHYDLVRKDPYSSFGEPEWVTLPSDILPLQPGDLLRVCLRDGLAAATAAGEHVGGLAGESSFWPRD